MQKRHDDGNEVIDDKVFKGEELTGQGTMTLDDGSILEGEFKIGELNGQGKMTFSDGSIVEGEFKDGKLNGQGKMTFDNGSSVFEGVFKDEKLNGLGKITFDNEGIVFEGEFKDGELNGRGKQIFDNEGIIFEGEFKDGKLNGQGKMTYTDGLVDEGEFKDGNLNGLGKTTYVDGTIFEGEYKDGKLNGIGKMIFENGDIFEGEFKDEKLNGQGKQTYADGTILEGVFKEGTFISGKTISKDGKEQNLSYESGIQNTGKLINRNNFQAIETEYNGYKFRSRLEARWAVFLDTLGVRYEYENEGFELGDLGRYLPDFYLPEQNTYLEIKPFAYAYRDFEDLEETVVFKKCMALALELNCWVYFIAGNPYFEEYKVTAIMPGSKELIRVGGLGLAPIPEDQDNDDKETIKKGFFSKLFESQKQPTYRYILYPVESGKVYIQTENIQNEAYRTARQVRFY